MDIHQLKQRIDASGKKLVTLGNEYIKTIQTRVVVIKPRPITDQCALTVLVWVHIKMKSEGIAVF